MSDRYPQFTLAGGSEQSRQNKFTVFPYGDGRAFKKLKGDAVLGDMVDRDHLVFYQPRGLLTREVRRMGDKRVQPQGAEGEHLLVKVVGHRQVGQIGVTDLHPYPADLVDVREHIGHDILAHEDHRAPLTRQDISDGVAAYPQPHQSA